MHARCPAVALVKMYPLCAFCFLSAGAFSAGSGAAAMRCALETGSRFCLDYQRQFCFFFSERMPGDDNLTGVPCRRCVLDEQDAEAAELLDSDLMITRSERRWRRGIAGTLAAAGVSATFVAPASMSVGAVFMTAALVAETAVGANF